MIEAMLLAALLLLNPVQAQTVQQVLDQYCVKCHNPSLRTANLDLQTSSESREMWEKVMDKLSARRMPPPGSPMPKAAESAVVISWIEKKFGTGPSDPGRVTARRLNRVEYNNTVRDLLGIDLRPANEFPVDDSGYGFDNIGDVLSVSPMLMEKYMAAARKVSRIAVYGEPYPTKPTVLTRLLAKRSHDAGNLANSNYLPYSMRGSLYGTYRFPVDGEYEFRFRVVNFRGQDEDDLSEEERAKQRQRRAEFKKQRGAGGGPPRKKLSAEDIAKLDEQARLQAPPRKVVLTIDGTPIAHSVVEGTTTFEYDRGEITARVPVKAGEHFLRASYPELADMDDPRQNINRDMRRKLFVDYLDIEGPFSPGNAPPESYRRLFVCGHAKGRHQASCVRPIVTNLARQAYRRPPTEPEVAGLLRLAKTVTADGEPFEEAIRVVVQAVLASPQFLFRIERESPKGSTQPVTDHELASRLSYFLWASAPDTELSKAADSHTLRKPGVLEAQLRRMLKDPKSEALISNFATQWLQLRNLDRSKPDPVKYPTVDDELIDAMRKETHLFLDAMIKENRNLLELLDAPFTFVNGPLARHYGIKGVDGEEFRRVELDGTERSGLLTQASILTVSSYSTRTSPVQRGKWVLENLLGTPPPAPPPDVPQLDESKIGSVASLRQQLEEHRKNPACAACHKEMDAIGFGLEGYDASGALRTHDGKFPVDTAGVMPDGKQFSGAKDLKVILRDHSAEFTRNIVEKTLTYALGRGLERTDRLNVDTIAKRLAQDNNRFLTLLLEVTRSAPFQMRRGEGGAQ